ncbi:unnamed protein product [Sphenostylis stenocarpa]|uniref:Uncharacterized protein n=1 Tax=Sphenostylis stenocarpa TaxID=92480 RepID=A0AA86W3F9_9FABA|nr:unnamed protein product [Sphenostylis stenocarpa]
MQNPTVELELVFPIRNRAIGEDSELGINKAILVMFLMKAPRVSPCVSERDYGRTNHERKILKAVMKWAFARAE